MVRSDAGLSDAVGTVDDVDSQSGRITAVLALQEMVDGGRPGQYGIGRGATSVDRPAVAASHRRVSHDLSASVLG